MDDINMKEKYKKRKKISSTRQNKLLILNGQVLENEKQIESLLF